MYESAHTHVRLCNAMDCSPLDSSVHGILQARILVCHGLLQVIFPTQASNPCLLHLMHCRWILYPLSHLGSPSIYIDTR